ncbi:cupin [Streptomyces bohaiensis]|uniref:Cupin n=1 Tax=Streptomyces bohaiensis TaxID=1431344 RepID=A0ABX1CGI8_9ACTN|nr:cupin [Streptomyces bohaiensis]NJQ17298.1 cupin [Streptomyces bohaiensis]
MEDINALVDEHLRRALAAEHGRSAHLFLHDGPLRQSVIALRDGTELGEHESPPAASLHVLRGTVRLTDGEAEQELTAGVVTELPRHRHGLRAQGHAAVLLTAVTAV